MKTANKELAINLILPLIQSGNFVTGHAARPIPDLESRTQQQQMRKLDEEIFFIINFMRFG